MKITPQLRQFQAIVFETDYDAVQGFAEGLQKAADFQHLEELRGEEYGRLGITCTFPEARYIILDETDPLQPGDLTMENNPEEGEDYWSVIDNPKDWENQREEWIFIRPKAQYRQPKGPEEIPDYKPGGIFGVKTSPEIEQLRQTYESLKEELKKRETSGSEWVLLAGDAALAKKRLDAVLA